MWIRPSLSVGALATIRPALRPKKPSQPDGGDAPADRIDPDKARRLAITVVMILMALGIAWLSAARTNAPFVQTEEWRWLGAVAPKQIDLSGERLLQPGATYQPRDIAIRAYWMQWCKVPDTDPCNTDAEGFLASLESAAFRQDFAAHRAETLREVTVGGLAGSDFAGAKFFEAVLPGLRLSGVNLATADFEDAVLEGVSLTDVTISQASFARADLRAARLTGGDVRNVSFRQAKLSDARLFFETMQDVDFRGADLRRAWLTDAVITGDFSDGFEARIILEGLDASATTFRNSHFDLSMNERALLNANFLGVNRSGSTSWIADTSRLPGTALRYVDLTALDQINADMSDMTNAGLITPWEDLLQNSFGDRTNTLPDWVDAPCQWLDRVGTQEEFYGAWRAWLEREPEETRQSWPQLSTLEQVLIPIAGQDDFLPLSEVPVRDDLLPPIETCAWE